MVNGPPDTSFFLLRGLAREIRHWGDFPNLLEDTCPDCRSILLEIPGAGKLNNSRAPRNIARYVLEIRKQYLAVVRPEDRNIIVGLSFGGMIAARWLRDFPDDFHGGILINTSSRLSPTFQRLRPSAAMRLLTASFYRKTLAREKVIAEVVCNLADTAGLATTWQRISDNAPITRGNILRQLWAAATFDLPDSQNVPTLLLGCDNDRLVDHSCSQRIARAWDIELLSHPLAGHDLPTDDPDWCCETIFSWMSRAYS